MKAGDMVTCIGAASLPMIEHLWRYRSDWMAAIALMLAVITTAPLIWDWAFKDNNASIYIRYDPFAIYIPGEVTGPPLNPMAATEGLVARSKLPDPPIIIRDTDGQLVTGPVWDLEISIWNGGETNINGNQVRQPLTISFPGVEKVLGIRILHAEERDGFKIDNLATSPISVSVRWDYMDRQSGVKFAVVFSGEKLQLPRAQIFFNGKLIEANRPPLNRRWSKTITIVFLFIAGALVAMYLVTRLPSPWSAIPVVLLLLLILMATWIGATAILPTAPPFT